MKIIVFGASGSLGRHLVNQALDMGHQVTAFSRRPLHLHRDQANYQVVSGDVTRLDDVMQAVKGQDAVIIALGAGRKGKVRSMGTYHVIQAMQRQGVKRLVCHSSLGVGESRGNLNAFWRYLMFGLLLRPAYDDHHEQEALVRESGLQWTIIRPGAFTDGPQTGDYRHGFSSRAKSLALKISRADVAHFALRQLNHRQYVHQAPGLSY